MKFNWPTDPKDYKQVFDLNLAQIVVVFSFFLLLVPMPWIPDFFKISSKAAQVFDLIINVSASILGIVVAVLILGIELLKQRMGRIAVSYFFKNLQLRKLITLLVLNILLCFLFRWWFPEHLSAPQTTVTYWLMWFFAFTITSVLPLAYRIMRDTTSTGIIEQIVKDAKYDDIEKFYTALSARVMDKEIQDNPVYVFSEMATNHLKEGDIGATEIIVLEYIDWLTFLYISDEEKRQRAMTTDRTGILYPLKKIMTEAIFNNRESILYYVGLQTYTFHEQVLLHRKNIADTEILHEFERTLLEKSYKFSKEVFTDLLPFQRKIIQHLIRQHIPHNPNSGKDQVYTVTYHDEKADKEWRLISDESFQNLSFLASQAAEEDWATYLEIRKEYAQLVTFLLELISPQPQIAHLAHTHLRRFTEITKQGLSRHAAKYDGWSLYPDADFIFNYCRNHETGCEILIDDYTEYHILLMQNGVTNEFAVLRHPLLRVFDMLTDHLEEKSRFRSLAFHTLNNIQKMIQYQRKDLNQFFEWIQYELAEILEEIKKTRPQEEEIIDRINQLVGSITLR